MLLRFPSVLKTPDEEGDSWCFTLFFITSHINSHLEFTFISPGWFTSQSFYTPNFIFHLTSLILFVNKAPSPYRASSRQRMGNFFIEKADGEKYLLKIDRFQVKERRTSRKLWQSRKLKRQTWVERRTRKREDSLNSPDDREGKLNFHWINSITKWKIIFSNSQRIIQNSFHIQLWRRRVRK